ncbi:MAG: hypothetical protein JWM44_1953, partial [Bacilli bacterium]|nr:hypothetical protein [Bacilli bacterium]
MNRNKLTLWIGMGLIILIIAFFSFQKAQHSTHVTSDNPKATS